MFPFTKNKAFRAVISCIKEIKIGRKSSSISTDKAQIWLADAFGKHNKKIATSATSKKIQYEDWKSVTSAQDKRELPT